MQFFSCAARERPAGDRWASRTQRRGTPRRRIKALTRVKHHVHPDEGPSEPNDVVPRDEKSKTYEESGANRTGRFFRGAVCSPIPARSYSSVSGSKIFTQIPRRRIKNIPFIQKQRCANRHFTCSTPLFSIFFFQVFPFFFSAAGPLLWLGRAPLNFFSRHRRTTSLSPQRLLFF